MVLKGKSLLKKMVYCKEGDLITRGHDLVWIHDEFEKLSTVKKMNGG